MKISNICGEYVLYLDAILQYHAASQQLYTSVVHRHHSGQSSWF
jgi:hypothetical protein